MAVERAMETHEKPNITYEIASSQLPPGEQAKSARLIWENRLNPMQIVLDYLKDPNKGEWEEHVSDLDEFLDRQPLH